MASSGQPAQPIFTASPIDRARVSTSISNQIFEAVRAGVFKPLQALPAERQLAQRFGVSRNSVREAIRILEHGRILEVRNGSGTYVTEDALSRAVAIRAEAAMVGDEDPLDIIAARQALEPIIAEHAARNRRLRDIRELSDNVKEQRRLLKSGDDTSAVDRQFHLRLAKSTYNAVFLILSQQIVNIMAQGTWQRLKGEARSFKGNGNVYLAQHEEILTAVEESDAPAAFAAMKTHLDAIEKGLLEDILASEKFGSGG